MAEWVCIRTQRAEGPGQPTLAHCEGVSASAARQAYLKWLEVSEARLARLHEVSLPKIAAVRLSRSIVYFTSLRGLERDVSHTVAICTEGLMKAHLVKMLIEALLVFR
jgi:hypothetical protein